MNNFNNFNNFNNIHFVIEENAEEKENRVEELQDDEGQDEVQDEDNEVQDEDNEVQYEMPYQRDDRIQQNFIPFKKEQTTYDDILASMNMKVVGGKLQMIQSPQQLKQQQQAWHQQKQQQQAWHQHQQQQQQNIHNIPIIENQQPISPLEYQQRFIFNLLRKREATARLKNIKSRKMLFPESNINISRPSYRTNNVGFNFVGAKR